TT
ncbi:hypothetical protein CP8484711_0330B, partial [Chlamydia psittaci 84-8471/1]